jgi:hypothetical protein
VAALGELTVQEGVAGGAEGTPTVL